MHTLPKTERLYSILGMRCMVRRNIDQVNCGIPNNPTRIIRVIAKLVRLKQRSSTVNVRIGGRSDDVPVLSPQVIRNIAESEIPAPYNANVTSRLRLRVDRRQLCISADN